MVTRTLIIKTNITDSYKQNQCLPQLAILCSKLTLETLEQGVKVVLVSLLLTLNIFHTLF